MKDQVEIKVTSEGLSIELLESASTGFFDTGSAKINGAGEKILVAIAHELQGVPNGVVFEGHTDTLVGCWSILGAREAARMARVEKPRNRGSGSLTAPMLHRSRRPPQRPARRGRHQERSSQNAHTE